MTTPEDRIYDKTDTGPCPFGCVPSAKPPSRAAKPRAGTFIRLSEHIAARHPSKKAVQV